jgi:hypothetical protein
MKKEGEETFWLDGLPASAFGKEKTGEETFWLDGLPFDYIILADSNDDFMPFFWGI